VTRHVLTILAVSDLARAATFFERAFGWLRAVDVPVYVEFEIDGGMRLGVYQREAFARNTGEVPVQAPAAGITATELYFHVEDIEAAIERLRAAGARELSPLAPRDWGDEAAYFGDPDGNVIVIARPVGDGR
jgi:predicted enzyme related to lactoylglutathione lyase